MPRGDGADADAAGQRGARGHTAPGRDGICARAAGFIRRNYASELSLDAVAEYAGISPDHLGRLFRAELGQTIAHYIEGVRVDHAAVLLERSRLTIAEVGVQVGFMTRQRLDAAFRRRYGMPPGAYRRKRRSGMW